MRFLNSFTLLLVLGFSTIGMADQISDLTARAEAGNAQSQFNLGTMYRFGLNNVTKDYKKAVGWFTKAAEQGEVKSQIVLGVMYANGNGVIQDYVQAHKWWNIAAGNGRDDVRKNRDNIGKKMTPEQIAEAQRLAKEWVKSHPRIYRIR